MRHLVIFDSQFGNTQKVAEAIAESLGKGAKAVKVSALEIKEVEVAGLIVVGSPIHGWKPSESMGKFLARLKKGQLEGVRAAAFDTRVKLFIHGDAAKKIEKRLKDSGAEIVTRPEAFYVKGTQGPLIEGEEQRAKEWAKTIKKMIGQGSSLLESDE